MKGVQAIDRLVATGKSRTTSSSLRCSHRPVSRAASPTANTSSCATFASPPLSPSNARASSVGTAALIPS